MIGSAPSGPSDRERLLGALLALRAIADGRWQPAPAEALTVAHRLLAGASAAEHEPLVAYRLPSALGDAVTQLADALQPDAQGSPDEPRDALVQALRDAADERLETPDDAILQLLVLADAIREGADATPPEVAGALGARAAAVAAATSAPSAPPLSGPMGIEARRRWERTDVVVLPHELQADAGAVLGIDVDTTFDPAVRPQGTDAEFAQGVRLGLLAARDLLAELACPVAEDTDALGWRLADVPPGFEVTGRSGGLPAALAALRWASRRLGDDLGPPAGVASGGLERGNDGWRVVPMGREAADKAALVEKDRGGTARLITNCASRPGAAVHVESLADAARAAWPERWLDWAASLRPDREDGWSVARGSAGLANEPRPDGLADCEPADLAELVAYFRAGDARAAVIGDLRRGGRTTLARLGVARLLEESTIDDAIWIAPPLHLAPGEDALRGAVERVAPMLRPYGTARVLVVIEDLEVDLFEQRGRIPLDRDVDAVARELCCPVLAVAAYDERGKQRWGTDGVRTFVGWEGTATAFTDALVAANGERLAGVTDRQRGVARDLAGTDLGVLRAALGAAAAGAEDRGEIVDALMRPLRTVHGEARESLRTLAAFSVLGVVLPLGSPEVAAAPPEVLAALGGRRGPRGWLIASAGIARRVAGTVDAPVEADAGQIAALVTAALRRRVEDGAHDDAGALLVAALRGAARLHDGSHEQLIRALEPHLEAWAGDLPPSVLAALLGSGRALLAAGPRIVVVRRLHGRTVRPATTHRVGELGAILHTLKEDRAVLKAAEWDELEEALDVIVRNALASDARASAQSRLTLLDGVLGFHVPSVRAVVHNNLEAIVRTLGPPSFGTYATTLRMIELVVRHRWAWFDGDERKHGVSLDHLAAADGEIRVRGDLERALLPGLDAIERLLEHPTRRSGIGVWLGWLSLCDVLGHDPVNRQWMRPQWDDLVQEVGDDIVEALDRASVSEAISAVNLMRRYSRGLCVRLFNRTHLAASFAARMPAARSFGERADLIELLAGLHAVTARHVLSPGGAPDLELAARLAAEATNTSDTGAGDLRGIGRFIRAAATVDELYDSPYSGFGRAFVERLGRPFVDRALEHEERTSLIFHFVEGLVAVDAPQVAAAARHASARLRASITRSGSAWGPRLALSIAALPDVGPRFLHRLRQDLDVTAGMEDLPTTLRRRLLHPMSGEAAVWSHRLAAALDTPDAPLAKGFVARVDDKPRTLLPRRHAGRGAADPDVVAEMCAVAIDALRRAGVEDARGRVRRWLKYAGWSWQDLHVRVPATDRLGPTLDALRRLDAPEAERAARAALEDPGSKLVTRVLALGERDPRSAVELLRALEACSKGAGSDALELLEGRGYRWRVIVEELLYEQNPVVQAQVVRQLLALGWRPSDAQAQRLAARWDDLMRTLRSPRALREVLRSLAELSEVTGDGEAVPLAARAIHADAVGRRLAHGIPEDWSWAGSLLGALRLADAPEQAERILDGAGRGDPRLSRGGPHCHARAHAPGVDARRMVERTPVLRIAPLLRELAALGRGGDLAEAREALRSRLAREMAIAATADPHAHWAALGRAAFAARQRIDAPPQRPATLHRGAAGTGVLSCGMLDGAEWAQAIVEDDLARIAKGVDKTHWAEAVALAVVGARAAPGSSGFVQRALTTGALWALEALLDRALGDDELAALLRPEAAMLLDRRAELEAERERLNPAAANVLSLMRILEPQARGPSEPQAREPAFRWGSYGGRR